MNHVFRLALYGFVANIHKPLYATQEVTGNVSLLRNSPHFQSICITFSVFAWRSCVAKIEQTSVLRPCAKTRRHVRLNFKNLVVLPILMYLSTALLSLLIFLPPLPVLGLVSSSQTHSPGWRLSIRDYKRPLRKRMGRL